jgi:hypothetical protein
VVKDLLEDLMARGLSTERRYLFVIDGAKALRAGIEQVFGTRAPRCNAASCSSGATSKNTCPKMRRATTTAASATLTP